MIGRLVTRADLTPLQIDSMFELLETHFIGVSRGSFEQDLEEKNFALLLDDDQGGLAGFSTILFYDSVHEGERVSVVYSGDTIVAPSHWNSPALSRSWIQAVMDLHARAQTSRLWWLLLSAGFRTYRFLPVYWRSFFPRYDIETPEASRRWMDELASARFGEQYSAAEGIVRFRNAYRLRPELAQPPAGKRVDPHVAYFLARNPGHLAGDELVCLTEIAAGNLTRAGWRMTGSETLRSQSLP